MLRDKSKLLNSPHGSVLGEMIVIKTGKGSITEGEDMITWQHVLGILFCLWVFRRER